MKGKATRIKKEKPSVLASLAPMPPSEGPPLPKRMNIRWKKPSRDKVKVTYWAERDRLNVNIIDKATEQKTYAEWWDEDVAEMFEDGFFKGSFPGYGLAGRVGSEIRKFEKSVLDYAQEQGIITA